MEYFTSDTHFFHDNIIKYEKRPFKNSKEMNEFIIEKWNKKVKPNDKVYCIGDFAFTKNKEEVKELVSKLNGTIYLILGNHDHIIRSMTHEEQKIFGWVKEYTTIKIDNQIFVLNHYPIQVWDRAHYGAIHCYGHVHSNSMENPHRMWYNIPGSVNVCMDNNNFELLSKFDIIEKAVKSKNGCKFCNPNLQDSNSNLLNIKTKEPYQKDSYVDILDNKLSLHTNDSLKQTRISFCPKCGTNLIKLQRENE